MRHDLTPSVYLYEGLMFWWRAGEDGGLPQLMSPRTRKIRKHTTTLERATMDEWLALEPNVRLRYREDKLRERFAQSSAIPDQPGWGRHDKCQHFTVGRLQPGAGQ